MNCGSILVVNKKFEKTVNVVCRSLIYVTMISLRSRRYKSGVGGSWNRKGAGGFNSFRKGAGDGRRGAGFFSSMGKAFLKVGKKAIKSGVAKKAVQTAKHVGKKALKYAGNNALKAAEHMGRELATEAVRQGQQKIQQMLSDSPDPTETQEAITGRNMAARGGVMPYGVYPPFFPGYAPYPPYQQPPRQAPKKKKKKQKKRKASDDPLPTAPPSKKAKKGAKKSKKKKKKQSEKHIFD